MEIIIFTTLIIIVFIVAFRANRHSKIDDSIALVKEIEKDFQEGFEHESVGIL